MNLQHRICVLLVAASASASVAPVLAAGSVAVVAQAPQVALAPEFSPIEAAEVALQNQDFQTRLRAAEFLAARGSQGIAVLERAVREHDSTVWIAAMFALEQSAPSRAVPLFLELLPQNLFVKNAHGQRMEFGYGSENGCIVISNDFGAQLAKSLGRIGDTRALPLLRDAARDGDSAVRLAALDALYHLKAATLDELIAAGPALSDVIQSIGCEDIHRNPRLAISIFDRIIAAFPDQLFQVAAAHYSKAQCFANLKEPLNALAEYDAVLRFPQFESLTQQATQHKAELLRQRR